MPITEQIVRKLLQLVDAGLTKGIGKPEPGQMCVEAAVCCALGLPHGDDPSCVAPTLRALKIRINDSAWSTNAARAKGLRRLAVAQLGSAGVLDEAEFRRRLVDYALRKSVPSALRTAASIQKSHAHKTALLNAAMRCEREASREAAIEARKTAASASASASAYAAYAAAYAAYAADAAYAAYAADAASAAASAASAAAASAASAAYAAYASADANKRDEALATYAEDIVKILIEMKTPGCQWLALTEAA